MIHRINIKCYIGSNIQCKIPYQILTLTYLTDIRILDEIMLSMAHKVGIFFPSMAMMMNAYWLITSFAMSVCLINISIAGSNTIKSVDFTERKREDKAKKMVTFTSMHCLLISLINLTSSWPNYAVEYFICNFLESMLRTHREKFGKYFLCILYFTVYFSWFCKGKKLLKPTLEWFIFHSKKNWSRIYKTFFVVVRSIQFTVQCWANRMDNSIWNCLKLNDNVMNRK